MILVMIPTMGPVGGSASTPAWCLICGERGGSDAIANTILFIPLGIALELQRWRAATAILFAAGVTLTIEGSQLSFIPGRDASISDLVFNTSGAILGLTTVRTLQHWLHPTRRVCRLLQIGSATLAGGLFALTGWLFQPDLEASRYQSQWAQWRSSQDVFAGTVESVHLDMTPMPPGRARDAAFVREQLATGQPVTIRGTAGVQPRGLGAIFTLRGERNRDVWTVAQQGYDLIFHYRPRAADFRLQEPNLRVSDAMRALADGSPFTLTVQKDSPGFSAHLNREPFQMSFNMRDGWRLFLYPFGVPQSWRWVIGYLWLAVLCFPLGFWRGGKASGVISLGLFLSGLMAATMFGMQTPPKAAELLAILVGYVAGTLTSARITPGSHTEPDKIALTGAAPMVVR